MVSFQRLKYLNKIKMISIKKHKNCIPGVVGFVSWLTVYFLICVLCVNCKLYKLQKNKRKKIVNKFIFFCHNIYKIFIVFFINSKCYIHNHVSHVKDDRWQHQKYKDNEFQESLKRSITKPSNLSENIVSAIRKKCITDDVGGIFENDGRGISLISK